jgi:hypothetical protein
MPARARQLAPVPEPGAEPEQDTAVPAEEVPPALAAPRKRRNAARRIQAATSDEKVRLPEGKRAVEVSDGVLKAQIAGKWFRLSDTLGLMPMMEWAAARDEIDVSNASALVGFYRVLQDLVHADDWQAFKIHTRLSKCGDQAFIDFQNTAMEAMAARPTPEPEAS